MKAPLGRWQRGLWRLVTVEPLLMLYVVPLMLSGLSIANLNLDKACRVNLDLGEEVCSALVRRDTADYSEQEVAVQRLVADMTVWTSVIQSLLPCGLLLLAGSWSDRHARRRPLMLLPPLGDLSATLGFIACTYYFYQLPMEVTGLVGSLVPALFGGQMVLVTGALSYIGDVTSPQERTVRIGLVNVLCTAAVPLGTALSGILLKLIGYYGVFTITASGYLLSFLYGLFYLKESRAPAPRDSPVTSPSVSLIQSLKRRASQAPLFVQDFFAVGHVRETLAVALKDGPDNRRQRVLMLMIVLIVIYGPVAGEMSVAYLFMRYRFNWDEVQFSMFSTYSVITHLIGTMFSVGVFSHMLKIDDALIGVISCISKILAGFVYAFAQTEWQVYLAPLVDIVNGTSFIAMRSIASKLVPPEELGKLNSLYGACEALTPLLYGPMYALVYAHTMDSMPGAFFLLGGALTLPAVAIFGWMYTQHRRDRRKTEAMRRKPSMAEEVIRNLRVDALAQPITPSILEVQQGEVYGGHINLGLQADKS